MRRAKVLYYPQLIDIADFGGVGDGTHDDTGALRRALEAAGPGGAIVFPHAGPWVLTGQVDVMKPVTVGDVWGYRAVISDQRPVDGPERLFNVSADDVTFRNLVFDGVSAPSGVLQSRHVAIYANSGRCWVDRCGFRNLTRKGALNAGGDASLASGYGVLFDRVVDGRVTDCFFDEVSGCGVALSGCEGVRVERNRVGMLSTGDCLYPIHVGYGSCRVWIRDNLIEGGSRRSGGAIDVMSKEEPSGDVFIEGNVVDGCGGTGSGTAVLRVLSVRGGRVSGNVIRNVKSEGAIYIHLNSRDLPTPQPSPADMVVFGNVLVAGGPNQRGIDVRDDFAPEHEGRHVTVEGNVLDGDGSWFGSGIRMRDIVGGVVRNNSVVYEFSSSTSGSFGVEVTEFYLGEWQFPRVEGNWVDCRGSVGSRGIQLDAVHAMVEPKVTGNTVVGWGSYAIRVEAKVSGAVVEGNLISA